MNQLRERRWEVPIPEMSMSTEVSWSAIGANSGGWSSLDSIAGWLPVSMRRTSFRMFSPMPVEDFGRTCESAHFRFILGFSNS